MAKPSSLAIDGYEFVSVITDFVTVDLIVWRTYRQKVYGVIEATLDANPHLAKIHKTTPFLPLGTQVRVPINNDLIKGRPRFVPHVTLSGNKWQMRVA